MEIAPLQAIGGATPLEIEHSSGVFFCPFPIPLLRQGEFQSPCHFHNCGSCGTSTENIPNKKAECITLGFVNI
jgi:hypothetical protein